MDFGDIFTLLLYIAVPLYISGKRKANKAKKAQQASQQRNRHPVQQKNRDGGLMGRLESMMKEIERSVETGEPIGGKKPVGVPKPVTKPTEPFAQTQDYRSSETVSAAGVPGQSESVQSERIPVWRVASEGKGEETVRGSKRTKPVAALVRETVPAAAGHDGALFGRDDLIKGIILSEILQPPVTLRQRNNRRSY